MRTMGRIEQVSRWWQKACNYNGTAVVNDMSADQLIYDPESHVLAPLLPALHLQCEPHPASGLDKARWRGRLMHKSTTAQHVDAGQVPTSAAVPLRPCASCDGRLVSLRNPSPATR